MNAPVQVLVIGFEPAAPDGRILTELERLRDAGLVRLVDLLVVQRQSDGALETIDLVDLPPGAGHVLADLLRDEVGAPGPQDSGAWWSVAEAVPVGKWAVIALLEHMWASPLVDAIAAAGGTPLDDAWLSDEDRARLRI